MNKKLLPAVLAGWLLPAVAFAADLDGSQLSVLWGVPFAGVLLSIALMPLLVPSFWHHHFGKVAAAWGLAFLVPFALTFGFPAAGAAVVHAALAEYIPFIILLTALFTATFGADPFTVGMLSSSYAICALIAGPLLGQLVRRPGDELVAEGCQDRLLDGFAKAITNPSARFQRILVIALNDALG